MTKAVTDPRGPELARLTAHLADATRSTMLLALLDGRAWTAGELASCAGVTAPTATEHLNRLLAARLVEQRRQGRHRYVQIADPRVAQLLEDLCAHLEPPSRPAGSLRTATARAALERGRTCYDHLAGRLGVAITDAMTRRGLLTQDGGFALTAEGRAWFTECLGVQPAALRATTRPVARACLDWTERRTHLAGAAGAQLCAQLLGRSWVERVGSSRAIRVTPAGDRALADLLDLAPQ